MQSPEKPIRFQKNEPQGSPAPGAEIQLRVHCGGRRVDTVLADLERGLVEALEQGRDPLVVLVDLGMLQDSITALIKGISRRLAGYPRTVTFWEASGYTEAFLSVMERESGS